MEKDFLFATSLTNPKVVLLSGKELEVLSLVASGLNSKDISIILDIMPKSVDNYKNRIAGKLGLKGYGTLCGFVTENREELLQWLKMLGLSERAENNSGKLKLTRLLRTDMENTTGGNIPGSSFLFRKTGLAI